MACSGAAVPPQSDLLVACSYLATVNALHSEPPHFDVAPTCAAFTHFAPTILP